jgi:hypothetical protein
MDSELSDFIADTKKHYNEGVKPLIEDEFYQVAGFELANINFLLRDLAPKLRNYHSGDLFMAASRMLERDLREGTDKPSTRLFEAYLSQVGLAIESGNTFS